MQQYDGWRQAGYVDVASALGKARFSSKEVVQLVNTLASNELTPGQIVEYLSREASGPDPQPSPVSPSEAAGQPAEPLTQEQVREIVQGTMKGVLSEYDTAHQKRMAEAQAYQAERAAVAQAIEAAGLKRDGKVPTAVERLVDAELNQLMESIGDPKGYANAEQVAQAVQAVKDTLAQLNFTAIQDAARRQDQTTQQTLAPGVPPGASQEDVNPLVAGREAQDIAAQSVIDELKRIGAPTST